MTSEYFQTGMKKGRGRAQRSLDLIKEMYEIAEDAQPIKARRGTRYRARYLISSGRPCVAP
jgi:hypothetical protein